MVSLLKNEGIDPWWDEKISPTANNFTQDFTQEIKDAITNSQCFLVIWTKTSVSSDWVRGETQYIRDIREDVDKGEDRVVPIAIDNPDIPPPHNVNQQVRITLGSGSSISEEDKKKILSAVKSKIRIIGKNEHIIHPHPLGEPWGCQDLAIEGPVPGTNLLSSFRPCGSSGIFLVMHLDTTDGWVHEDIPDALRRHEIHKSKPDSSYKKDNNTFLKIQNDVYFINDPIRPYSIQIGGIRSTRPHAKPGIIKGNITKRDLNLLPIGEHWLSLTLAEILTNEDSLRELLQRVDNYIKEGKTEFSRVREAIARNPFSPMEIQTAHCLFCDNLFKNKRQLYKKEEYGTTIISNDFPFGPYFHYITILDEPIHAWEDTEYRHLLGLNRVAHEYLSDKNNLSKAIGIEYGFNSTVRHLVLGTRTHSSAGASIPHIHKQIWGMAPHTANLAERLITVSEAYSNINIDYQGCYIDALRHADYVVWEDDLVVLYVPYGQCSLHELQIMVLRPCGTFIELTGEEVTSVSKAEFIIFRLYKELGITSFNSILITKLFNEKRAPTFRLVQAFVTREIDLAVSELSMLYVVDQHPNESKNEIKKIFKAIEDDVLSRW